MKRLLSFSILALSALGAMAQTTLGDADIANAYKSKSYTQRVVCHDPSIVMDNITSPSKPIYYIYGSHLGRGKTYASSNYQNWATFKSGEENTGTSNSLFADVNGKAVNFKDAYSTHVIKKVKNYQGQEVTLGNFDAHAWQYKGQIKNSSGQWVQTENTVAGMQWAPDIIYNKTMKKWCMYMLSLIHI